MVFFRPKVFIARKIPRGVEEYIGRYCDYEKWDSNEPISKNILIEKLIDKDGLLVRQTPIDIEILNSAPRLKVISNIAVGYNNFDLKEMKLRKIIGTNAPGILDNSVSDLIFGLLLSSARRIPELDRYVKSGNWNIKDNENLFGLDVYKSTIGIIGMGRIGQAVAKRAKYGFDMDVLYYNRQRRLELENNHGYKYTDLDTLLKTSDFIVLMIPLNNDTYHLIDQRELELMKSSAIFINASRGETVNENALINALANKKIAGAGLDVYNTEPIDRDNPILKLNNVITTPHIGGSTEKTRYNMSLCAATNLVKALQGEIPPNIVPELIWDILH